MQRKGLSTLAIVGALVAIAGLATAAVLWTTGDQALERLGILVAVFASIIPGLISVLRSDQAAASSHQAAEQTNGTLDARIQAAVQAAVQVRRPGDVAVITPTDAPPAQLDPDPLTVDGAPIVR